MNCVLNMFNHPKTSWKIYTSPPPTWTDMLSACKTAKKSIELEEYIFVDDSIGRQFIDICREKAKEGVKVRFLCDTAGSFPFYGSTFINNLQKDGIEVQFFNTFVPVIWKSHYSWWFFRDHRKLMVIDEEVAFTGGICIWEDTKDWRDTSVRLTGVVVKEMQESFNAMWEWAKGNRAPDSIKKAAPHKGLDGFNFVSNIPRLKKRDLYYRLVEMMRHAEKEISIAVPYFAPDRRILRVLLLARRRGVNVKILLPKNSDFFMVDVSARTYFYDLLKAGVRIYLYDKSFYHGKTIVVDGLWATLGSMNLDNVSLRYNFEGNIVSTDEHFVNELRTTLDTDFTNAKEITLKEWIIRPFFQKFLEFFVRFIRAFI